MFRHRVHDGGEGKGNIRWGEGSSVVGGRFFKSAPPERVYVRRTAGFPGLVARNSRFRVVRHLPFLREESGGG